MRKRGLHRKTYTPVIGLVRDLQLAPDISDLGPLTEENLCLPKQSDDLLRRKPFPAHVQLPSSSKILPQGLDPLEGGRSKAPFTGENALSPFEYL